jgi:uncharacterized protein (DUF983 family)
MDERDIKKAVLNGCRGVCPCCGEGRLFYKYLKVSETCSSCGLRMSAHNADDAPAWMTLILVVHIVAPLVMASTVDWGWSLWLGWSVWPLVTLALCLIILPLSKGGLIGYQWAKRLAKF